MLDYGALHRFASRHGSVSFLDPHNRTRRLPGGGPDMMDLVDKADRFLWVGHWRSRTEMEMLISQSDRGLQPGCAECERLESELVKARDRDRREGHLETKHEAGALDRLKDHRGAHQ